MKAASARSLIKTVRAWYGKGIITFGIQPLIASDFIPEVSSSILFRLYQNATFSIILAFAMIAAGLIILGFFSLKNGNEMVSAFDALLFKGVVLIIVRGSDGCNLLKPVVNKH